ncbi:MAG: RNA polymerase sigma factor [Candidatus Aminicenantia bacterium]
MEREMEANELILKAVAGEKEAFNMLMEQNYKRIFNFINRIVRDPDKSDDIAQEVFLKVYLNKNKFRPDSDFYAWVYKIATNQVLKHFSKERIINKLLLRLKENPPSNGKNSLPIDLTPFLKRLKPKERVAIQLIKYDGYSYEEASKLMSASVGAVKTYVHRGILKLKKFIKEEENAL